MNICIPITERNYHPNVMTSDHFGSAPYFMIYDTDQNAMHIIENTNQGHQHGMCQPLNALNQKSIQIVICKGMGKRALTKMNDAGIRVFHSADITAQRMLEAFMSEKLSELTLETACSAHRC